LGLDRGRAWQDRARDHMIVTVCEPDRYEYFCADCAGS